MNIIKKEKSNYYIVSSKTASECVRYAASELQKYLYLSTNCCIPIYSDKCDKYGPEIIVGGARGLDLKDKIKDKSSEAFIISSIGDDLIIDGNSDRAILYGVYRFLEDYIHFRCFTSELITYDNKKDIIFENEIIYDFPFEYREVYFTDAFKREFASCNMLNSNLASLGPREGGRNKWYNFHHSFSDICSPKEYFSSHPEYFSEIDGKRVGVHTELCLSNEDVFKMAVDKVLQWKKNNPECKIFSVAQDEWMGHFIKMACECKNCKALDDKEEAQSASIINFVSRVAKEVNKVYPDVLIHTFAYQYSRKPPKTLVPDKNVIVRLCNIECSWSRSIEEEYKIDKNSKGALFYDDFMKWSKITNRLYIWDYAVNFRNYLLPFPNLRSMVKNIEFYKKNHVKGLLMQGNFSHGGKGYLDKLKSYIAARYMRYDNLKLEDEIMEFARAYYGAPSAKYVLDFINLFEDAVKGYDLWLYDDSDHPMFTDELEEKAANILCKAYAECEDKAYLAHLNELSLNLAYLNLTRLPLDTKDRDKMIDDFYEALKFQHITEIFERTRLEYSIDVMKKSRYAKDRPNWQSLYYIMQ